MCQVKGTLLSLPGIIGLTQGDIWASQVARVVENPPANAGDIRDMGLIPESVSFPGEGNGNPIQYSSLENPMDRGTWWATVHRVAQSQTRLKFLSMHSKEIFEDSEQCEIAAC